MHWIDWAMVVIPLVGLIFLAVYTQRYVRGVSDYISAGRCAGRYLLTSSAGEAGAGATNTVANVEKFMIMGFVGIFWDGLITPVLLFLSISGFVIYRYRQTRVLTLAQFFEERYSRGFRILVGWLLFLSGGIGYVVFPLVSCLFFKAFLGLPDSFSLAGMNIPTNAAIMASYLSITVFMISFGGQVTLMITDCVEGVFSHLAYIIIIFVIFSVVSWSQVTDVLTGSIPDGITGTAATMIKTEVDHSLVDPFDAFKVADFNFFATLIGIFGAIYLFGAGQGGHGFRSAARTPHEGRMAGILGAWRGYAKTLVIMTVAIGAITYLRHPDFAPKAEPLKERIAMLPSPSGTVVPKVNDCNPIGSQPWVEGRRVVTNADGSLTHGAPLLAADGTAMSKGANDRQKKQAPFMALSEMLPVGIKGLFLVIMIMGLFAGDGNHIISWSSIFIQDCVMPLRKTPLSVQNHLRLLRWAAFGMACIGFIGALLLPLKVPIWVWWAVTGAIYNGGAGAVLIGGLYWSRGTAQAAWATMVVSAILGLSSVFLVQNWFGLHDMAVSWGVPSFLVSGFYPGFIVSLIAITVYITVSLLTCRKPYDLQSILSRSAAHKESQILRPENQEKRPFIYKIMGIDEHFTKTDRAIALFIFFYGLMMTGLVVVMSVMRYVLPNLLESLGYHAASVSMTIDKHTWTNVWLIVGLLIPGTIAVITLFWFGIGSIIDMRQFFKDSASRIREADDDGVVRRKD